MPDFDWDTVECRYTDVYQKYWTRVDQLQTELGTLDIMRGQTAWMIGKVLPRVDKAGWDGFRAILWIDRTWDKTFRYKAPNVPEHIVDAFLQTIDRESQQ